MTVFKRWLQNLIYKCALLVDKDNTYSYDDTEFNTLVKQSYNFINYYNLDKTREVVTFIQYTERKSDFGFSIGGREKSKERELLTMLLGLMKYEQQVPKYFDRVFISHSSKDIDVVKPFVELLASIGLSKDKLFCSSVDGYGIPLGENIYDYLKREFTDKNTLVIMMMSDNYYDSKPSLNEMGAAWVMSKEYISILIKDFSFDKIEGAADKQKIGFEISNNFRLDEFKDRLIKELRLKPNANWNANKQVFLTKIANLSNEEK